MRLLLVQLYHMGDVLLTTPAIRAAREAFPDARIEFLTGGLGADALQGNRHLDDIIIWRRGITHQLRLALQLRRGRYDAVVDFHSRPSTAYLTAATGAAVRIGIVGRGPRNRAYTALHPREVGAMYMARQKLRLLEHLDVDTDAATDLRLDIAVSPEDRDWADAELERLGVAGPTVAISGVSRIPFKQWGAERWAAVGDALADAGFGILLTHGPGEADQAAAIAGAMKNPAVSTHRPTTIRQLAALYQRCAVWAGNDGGPKHVAAAAGVPTVMVVRANLDRVWNDPEPETRQWALTAPPPAGCNRRCADCSLVGCLAAIEPAEVAAAVLEMAGRTADREA